MPGPSPGHPDSQGSLVIYFFRWSLSRLRYPTTAAIRPAIEAINEAINFDSASMKPIIIITFFL